MKFFSKRFSTIFVFGFVLCLIAILGNSSPSLARQITKPVLAETTAITSGMPLGNSMVISDPNVTRNSGQPVDTAGYHGCGTHPARPA